MTNPLPLPKSGALLYPLLGSVDVANQPRKHKWRPDRVTHYYWRCFWVLGPSYFRVRWPSLVLKQGPSGGTQGCRSSYLARRRSWWRFPVAMGKLQWKRSKKASHLLPPSIPGISLSLPFLGRKCISFHVNPDPNRMIKEMSIAFGSMIPLLWNIKHQCMSICCVDLLASDTFVLSWRSLVDVVYALRDEVQELKQVNDS